MRKTTTLALALAAGLSLAACGTSHPAPAASSSAPAPAASSSAPALASPPPALTAEQLATRLGVTGQPGYVAYTAATDPNHLLGRQNGYTSKVNWGSGSAQQSSIEVFPTKAGAIQRASYVSGFTCPFGDGYDYISGSALLRMSCLDTPAQAHALEAAFQN